MASMAQAERKAVEFIQRNKPKAIVAVSVVAPDSNANSWVIHGWIYEQTEHGDWSGRWTVEIAEDSAVRTCMFEGGPEYSVR